jgi:hypothetical protein
VNDNVNLEEGAVDDPDDDLVIYIVATINIVDMEAPVDELDEATHNSTMHGGALTSVGNLIAYAQLNQTSKRDLQWLFHMQCNIGQQQVESQMRWAQLS